MTKVCPTPEKAAYPSEAAAKKRRSLARWIGRRMRAYHCPCGRWHLTKEAKR